MITLSGERSGERQPDIAINDNESARVFGIKNRFETDRFIDAMRKQNGKSPEILPPGALWVSGKQDRFIIQEPPRHRNISIRFGVATGECECEVEDEDYICDYCGSDTVENHLGNNSGWENYFLPIPWTLYTFTRQRNILFLQYIFISPTPVETTSQKLGTLPLPNMYTNGRLCPGTTATSIDVSYETPLSFAVNSIIESFWGSAFNMEVRQYAELPFYMSLPIKSPKEGDFFQLWENIPIEELGNFPWVSTDVDLSLDGILGEGDDNSCRHRLANIIGNNISYC